MCSPGLAILGRYPIALPTITDCVVCYIMTYGFSWSMDEGTQPMNGENQPANSPQLTCEHYFASIHQGGAVIWIRQCMLCNAFDVDDLNEQITQLMCNAWDDGWCGGYNYLHPNPIGTPYDRDDNPYWSEDDLPK